MAITTSKGKTIKGLPGSSLVSFYGKHLPDITFKVVEIVRPKFKKKILNKTHREFDYYVKLKQENGHVITEVAMEHTHFCFQMEKGSVPKFTGKKVKIIPEMKDRNGQTVRLELI